MLPTKDSLQTEIQAQTKKGWKKILHATTRDKKAGDAILLSDKIDFKTKKVTRQSRTLHNDKGVNPTKGQKGGMRNVGGNGGRRGLRSTMIGTHGVGGS